MEASYEEMKDLTEGAFDRRIQEQIVPPPHIPEREVREQRQQIHKLFHGQIQANPHLSAAEKQTLENILYHYYVTLSKGKYDVGCTDLLEFEVDMQDTTLVKARCRPMPPEIKRDF